MAKERTHVGKDTDPFCGETITARRARWGYPLVGAVLVAVAGVLARQVLEDTLKRDLEEDLQALLAAKVKGLTTYLEGQKQFVEEVARGGHFGTLAGRVWERFKQSGGDPLAMRGSPEVAELRAYLEPTLKAGGYLGFALLDSRGQVVAAFREDSIGLRISPKDAPKLERVLKGKTLISPPHPFQSAIEGVAPFLEEGTPTMTIATRVRLADDVAIFGFRIDPQEFTDILMIAQPRRSGETYAFDQDGVLISHSRFEEELRAAGVIPAGQTSVLNVQLRNPGVNIMEGKSPPAAPKALPFTAMAAVALDDSLDRRSGVNVDGYLDYRGVEVVGAWTWLDDHGFGVAAEVDVAEAKGPVRILRVAFGGLVGLLALSALGTLAYARYSFLLRSRVREAVKLGQYTLVEKIGEGGMGDVYRSRHRFLQRPTAVKVLRPDAASETNLARFEKEVQITSQLSHPNTIAVYDFGHSPDGTFFYAMEYLSGLSLAKLVKVAGPVPEARAIHLLKQVCGSLEEAHGEGLIHRDIKPTNIMTCYRGGIPDMVKVLDFGLVRDAGSMEGTRLTQEGYITGTPLFMSPEAIQNADAVDARSDLYSLGLVAYNLLCGKLAIDGDTVVDVCAKQVKERPAPPSERLGRSVHRGLEDLVMRCLQKDPNLRPQSAGELWRLLNEIRDAGSWTLEEALAWWRKHGPEEVRERLGEAKAAAAMDALHISPAREDPGSRGA